MIESLTSLLACRANDCQTVSQPYTSLSSSMHHTSSTILHKTNQVTSVGTTLDKIGSGHFRFSFHSSKSRILLARLSLKCLPWLCHKTMMISLGCHDTSANMKTTMRCEDTLTISKGKALLIRAGSLAGDTWIRKPILTLVDFLL